jgi:hypothetical protein
MVLAVILFAGFVGIALVASLLVLAFIDVAFNVWESADRADRTSRYARDDVQPRQAEVSASLPPVHAHHWAQSA